MELQKPSLGRIVLYRLTPGDAEKINRRRTTGGAIAERIAGETWPDGAQAHIGNTVNAGDEFPATVVRVWDQDNVNLQVLLDGNDVYWATTIPPVAGDATSAAGCWRWPPRT